MGEVISTHRATVREKGRITLPSEIRAALHVEDGADVEFALYDDGQVVLHGLKLVRADQAWFWDAEWQAGERAASEDIKAGRTTVHPSVEEMFDHLGG